MPSLEAEGQVVRRQLERVLGSPGFARNERLSRFLRFVVEGHLAGKDDELKESVIAVEVFGRSPGFDSRLDPVVRTEAVRLRARLKDYYLDLGKAESDTLRRISTVRASKRRDDCVPEQVESWKSRALPSKYRIVLDGSSGPVSAKALWVERSPALANAVNVGAALR